MSPPQKPICDRIIDNIVVVPSGCWIWTGWCNEAGYGIIDVGSRARGTSRHARAHRVSYECFVGLIPDGLKLDHLCRERGCVNWRHLEPVTQRENVLRGVGLAAQNARQTKCRKCDELLSVYGGVRCCKSCRKLYSSTFKRQARKEGRNGY